MKNTKYPLLATMALLLMATKCKDDFNGKTTVYGHVYTKGTTNYPDDSATEIGVQYYSYSGGGVGGGWGYVEKIMTDENGYYNYTFNAEAETDYRLIANKGFTNHWHPYSYSAKPITVGKNQEVNLEIAPVAYLQLHVRNQINPQFGDELWINWGGGQQNVWYGDFNDTIVRTMWGNGNNPLSISMIRNGIGNALHDTIYLPAFDTTYYLIDIDL